MNNTFDIKRFGQVVAKDWKNFIRNFGISLIVWCCLPILIWIFSLVVDVEVYGDARLIFIAIFVYSVLLFAPAKIYGNANLSRDGISFATLPATSLEKFLSMVLYCSILPPIIVGLGSWAIDSMLTLLPFGGFKEFVVLPKQFLGAMFITAICQCLMISAMFQFGNMIFKKRKVGKTIAWALLLLFVITMLFQIAHLWGHISAWLSTARGKTALWTINAIVFAIAVVFYLFTYRRIKKQTY